MALSYGDISWSDAPLQELLDGPGGAVARHLAIVGTRVESDAKHRATGLFHGTWQGKQGRPSNPGANEGPGVRTGRLRNSIGWKLGNDGIGLFVDIGAGASYAVYVELGTQSMPGGYPFLRPAVKAANF